MPSVLPYAIEIDGNEAKATYGLVVAEIRGQWDAPTVVLLEEKLPDDDGALDVTPDDEQYESKELVLVGVRVATDVAAWVAGRYAMLKAIYKKPIQIIAGTDTTRYRQGRIFDYRETPFPSIRSSRFEMHVRCSRPLLYAVTATVLADNVALPQGSARTRPIITGSSFTNPTILTHKDGAGATIRTMTIAAAGTVIIDCVEKTITVGGVDTPGALIDGDFFVLKPEYGDGQKITTNHGTLSISYRKAEL